MQTLNSKVGSGFTTHTRFSPVKRTFKYNLNYLLIDIINSDEINSIPFLSLNSTFFFSCTPKKYLLPGKESFEEKLKKFLKYANSDIQFNNAYLLSSPSFFSVSFNPVSFFYLYNDQSLTAIIAEVHNTYKEKHMYLLSKPIEKEAHYSFEHQKLLHVSPFFKVEGKYDFLFSKKLDTIDITINYKKGSKLMLNAKLKLSTSPLSKLSFFKLFFNFISTSFTTFPKILFQALILKFKFKLPHFSNSTFKSKNSFSRKTPTLFERLAMFIIKIFLKKLHFGHFTIHLPNHSTLIFGQEHSTFQPSIKVHCYSFFTSLLLKGDIGLGDAFIRNAWTTDNLQDIFKLFIQNQHLIKSNRVFAILPKLFRLIKHKGRRNSIKNSKKNIFEHYDLGNDFFKLFLDKNMVYSSAIYTSTNQTLEDAQFEKIKRAIDLCDISPNQHLLEIGSGWGALSIQAAKKIGCRVTTVTISEAQYKFVKQMINKEHLDHLIEVKLMDYRYLSGKYDRIISIEMLEAVGHEFLETYFNQISKLLTTNGKAMFQCITIPENRYENYRKNPDFIQTHIFPGGHLPTIELLQKHCLNSSLKWISSDDIAPHYVKTLSEWENKFINSKPSLELMGFNSEFFNKWIYYFNYCKAGFDSKFINNYQFVIQK